jgi:hypothetical protein
MRCQRALNTFLLTIFLVLPGAQPLLAQCTGNADVSSNAFFEEALQAVAAKEAADQPLEAPPSQQTAAPADSASSTSLVNGAGFPNLLALATETGLVSDQNGVLTADLNLFAARAALTPQVIYRQSLYEDYEDLRRFGGSLSFGGKGESFDRDGDGQADPALESQELGDIVNWELRWRFKGSRDRRDKDNAAKFFSATDAAFVRSSQDFANFFARHSSDILAMASATNPSCLDRARMEEWVQRPEITQELLGIVKANKALDAAIQAAAEEIDGSPIWSLFAGGISRRDQFGPDTRKAGIRGALGGDDNGFTLNLEWSQTDGFNGADDPTLLKAALEYARLAFKGIALTQEAAQNGVRLSLSGSYEKFEDVPDSAHDTNAKLNVKLELPLTATIKIPISVTWANHKDLIEGEDEIRGHIGFTLDLSPLRAAIKP